jgi:hypothetical protein
MASLKLTILNMALRSLGAAPITDAQLTAESVEQARVFNDIYQPILEEVLAAHPWGFAKNRISLDASPYAPGFDFDYAFDLPFNCLRVLRMVDNTKYQIEGARLITDEETADVEYITLVNDYSPYAKVVLHFDGTDAAVTTTESVQAKTVTFGGTAALDTAQYKFGTASLLLDGDSDYISMPAHKDWSWSDGKFGFNKWIRIATDQDGVLIGQYYNATNYWHFKYSATDSKLYFKVVVAGTTIALYSVTWNPTTATWYHLELNRSGEDIYLSIDGIQQTLTETTAISTSDMPEFNAALIIGCQNSADYFAGWIDEIEILKGIVKHIADFIPEAVAYGTKTREEKFSPAFVTAFAIRLAAEMAFPISNSTALQAEKYKEYLAKLRLAKSISGQEGVVEMVEDTSWLDERA